MRHQVLPAGGVLREIAEHKRAELVTARVRASEEAVRRAAMLAPAPRDFAAALRRPGLSVIAEIKQASPTAGVIRSGVDAADLARRYVAGGADALSVLTDERFFAGRPQHLIAARAAVQVPVLRKDFIVDPYQVHESRAMGADAVLLLTALLDKGDLRALIDLSSAVGLMPLVEVHTEDEVARALASGAQAIGINNRDLETFTVDLETTARLRPLIPAGVLVVSESGIATREDAARVRPHADAILVGTSVMRSDDPSALIRQLKLEEDV